MAEEVGIVMSLYDRVSPTLKAIAGNTKAFDKNLDDLERSLKEYDKTQDTLSKNTSELRKALEAANQKVTDARKAYKQLKDEASKGALDDAIDEQARLKRELDETERSLRTHSKLYDDLYDKARKAANGVRSAGEETSKLSGSSGGSLGMGEVLTRLGAAGLTNQLGDALSQAANVGIESFMGQPTASAVSSILSGAVSGAATGAMFGAPGVAIGALVGGTAGAITGGSQIYAEKDDTFKSYVQESVEGQLSEMDSIRSSGSTTAGQREQDQIAFAQRFGSDEAAQDYLDQVKAMAVGTNYTYDEITGYSKSLLNSYTADETLDVLQKLSDATAGLNLDSGGVSMFIAGLSRMRTTDKTTQEYLNYFSERGLDVYEALSRSTGADKSQISEMVTDGKIGGVEAAQAILDYIQEEFGGLSEKLSTTYDAMVDNLGDAEASLNARMGEGYNEARKAGLQAQMDWLESDQLGDAYEAIGAWKAELENAKEQYIRDAVNEAMSSEDYQTAQAEGDAAEMGRIIMQAKIQGMNEYNANEGKDEVLAQETALIEGVRADTSLNDSYWDAGYTLGQEFSKGRAAGMASNQEVVEDSSDADTNGGGSSMERSVVDTISSWLGFGGKEAATGLQRVPYNNFPAVLHEGERVLTAREARNYERGSVGSGDISKENSFVGQNAWGLSHVPYDNYPTYLHQGERVLTAQEAQNYERGGSGGITINLYGTVIREDADIEKIGQAVLDRVIQARVAGVYG